MNVYHCSPTPLHLSSMQHPPQALKPAITARTNPIFSLAWGMVDAACRGRWAFAWRGRGTLAEFRALHSLIIVIIKQHHVIHNSNYAS